MLTICVLRDAHNLPGGLQIMLEKKGMLLVEVLPNTLYISHGRGSIARGKS